MCTCCITEDTGPPPETLEDLLRIIEDEQPHYTDVDRDRLLAARTRIDVLAARDGWGSE